MPVAGDVQNIAEFGLWIAWANKLELSYWKKRMDALSDGHDYSVRSENHYLIELRNFDKVVQRLDAIGRARFGSMIVSKRIGRPETVLDVVKLRNAGAGGAQAGSERTFLSRVAQAARDPLAVFANLADAPPAHKAT